MIDVNEGKKVGAGRAATGDSSPDSKMEGGRSSCGVATERSLAVKRRLRTIIDRHTGKDLIVFRELSDEKFRYPDRHRTPFFSNVQSFMDEESAEEFELISQLGYDPMVLRKIDPSFKSAYDGQPFKFYLCGWRRE